MLLRDAVSVKDNSNTTMEETIGHRERIGCYPLLQLGFTNGIGAITAFCRLLRFSTPNSVPFLRHLFSTYLIAVFPLEMRDSVMWNMFYVATEREVL
jgi:hypothetical protein